MSTNPFLIPLAAIAIRDTTTHTYRTDPWDVFKQSGIQILPLSQSQPAIKAYSLFIYNATDQALSVQPVNNIQNDKTYPDINQGTTASVSALADDLIQYNFYNDPIEYLSVALSFATAPTLGEVLVFLMLYY